MKKLFLSFVTALWVVSLPAQESDFRFGKVSEEELRMERYEKDPDANAVVLYEETSIHYLVGNQLSLIRDYFVRIKVFKSDGADVANVELPYIFQHENYANLDAVAYNLVDGKIVKSPMRRQYLFREQVDGDHWLLKFSIPEVREGTVIEYRYSMNSDFVTSIDPVILQHGIPAARTKVRVMIPEYFRFNVNLKGYLPIEMREDVITGTISGTNYHFNEREIAADGVDIPALKREPFVWDLDEFRSMITFELSQLALPNTMVRNFSASWKDVNESLAKSKFNDYLHINNPFRDEVEAIRARNLPQRETLHEILRTVQSHMKWNHIYNLFGDSPREAADKGEGSSSEINFVLAAALRDAGFKVDPILLNPRFAGRLPQVYATIDGIHTFILRVTLADGSFAYLDGTNPHADVDLLPKELLVDRARVYGVDNESGWCDLSHLAPSSTNINMIIEMRDDRSLHAQVVERYTNQAALETSTEYDEAQSEEKYIEKLEKQHEIRIEELKINGTGTPVVTQEYTMVKKADEVGDLIYLNATIIPFLSDNPFKSAVRNYPVEFDLPRTYNILGSIRLPEGYVVEELPRAASFNAFGGDIACFYMIRAADGVLQFNMRFTQKRIIFLPEEYADLQAMFGAVAELCNRKIVLRKQQ